MECNHFKRKKLIETTWAQPPPSSSSDNMKRHALIVVCSTSGNGDAPENASRFVRHIKKPPPLPTSSSSTLLPLEHVAYAVLGLGDTNYDKFCEAGKIIDKKLHEWGAKRSMALTCADEATGLEETVEPWLHTVLKQLGKACTADDDDDEHHGEAGKDTEAESTALNKEVEEKLSISVNETAQSTPSSTATADPITINGQSTKSSSSSDGNASLLNNITTPPNKSPTPLYILYGSATGNSEHIAKDLCSTYESYLQNPSFIGYFPSVVCCELNQFKKKCLDTWVLPPDSNNTNIKHGILIISSTTGNANAPENADRFYRWLKREPISNATFQHCAYAILGLGDSNYDVFNAIGKGIDKRLCELGGCRAAKVALADEATGLEDIVDPWVGSIIGTLANACKGGRQATTEIGNGSRVSMTTRTTGVLVSSPPPATSDLPRRAVVATTSKEETSEEQIDSSIEEKKMDSIDDERIAVPITSSSTTSVSEVNHDGIGVWTIRKLLSLSNDDPIPTIPNSSLPSVMTSLSSCELIHDEEGIATATHRSRGESIADNMTVSSASSGYLYTFNSPYESSILSARYLTETNVECAAKVAKEVLAPPQLGVTTTETSTSLNEDEKLLKGMKLFDEYFPLSASTPTPTNGIPNGGDEQRQLQRFEKNGKRVIEMVCSLANRFTICSYVAFFPL